MPRIAEVALFTGDVPGLAAFYERLLGRPPESSSESHASFDLDGTTLFIHVAGLGGVAIRTGAPWNFRRKADATGLRGPGPLREAAPALAAR